tara:strand:+ start:246 stop:434 length:189 start_codon:yes stop_codon:yes gene_type:complete
MKKYKLVTVSQTFTLKGLEEKANEQLNKYAEEGWEVVEMRKGWSGFGFSTLFILFEHKGNID